MVMLLAKIMEKIDKKQIVSYETAIDTGILKLLVGHGKIVQVNHLIYPYLISHEVLVKNLHSEKPIIYEGGGKQFSRIMLHHFFHLDEMT